MQIGHAIYSRDGKEYPSIRVLESTAEYRVVESVLDYSEKKFFLFFFSLSIFTFMSEVEI